MTVEHICFGWKDAEPTCAHEYLLPAVTKTIRRSLPTPAKIVDLGCGNGYVASRLAELGHLVVGVDLSPDGIAIARAAYPQLRFEACSVYDDRLTEIVGEADCVVCLEVIEHLLHPKRLFEQSWRILSERGIVIVSTPYHGYLKNLAISLINGWDRHFEVHHNGGHIKFFSKKTLVRMVREAGFKDATFSGVGRAPWLWKSMLMVAEK